jgi:hypothetical protein
MAWMKALGRVWMPGFGGISTSPFPFSTNIASSASMISDIETPTSATSCADR